MNQITLIGKLGAAPVIKAADDFTVAKVLLGSERTVTYDGELYTTTDWHVVNAHDELAEVLLEAAKGDEVRIEGWVSTSLAIEDGRWVATAWVCAESVEILERAAA